MRKGRVELIEHGLLVFFVDEKGQAPVKTKIKRREKSIFFFLLVAKKKQSTQRAEKNQRKKKLRP